MNKKFLSAILFGALMVTSTGTFVSCKDYDDDIDNLQTQIDKLATKDELSSQISSLQTALSTAQSEAAAAKTAAAEALAKANSAESTATEAEKAAAQAALDAANAKADAIEAAKAEVEAAKAELEAAVAADFAALQSELTATVAELTEKVEKLTGLTTEMITSIDWQVGCDANYGNFSYNGGYVFFDLSYSKMPASWTVGGATVKSITFGQGLEGALTLNANETFTSPDYALVSVSPANAVLTSDMVSLINSKGESLNEYVDIKVEPYTGLLTRAAANTGLHLVSVSLAKDITADKLDKVRLNDKNNTVRFALNAVKDGRAVTTEYNASVYAYEYTRGIADFSTKSTIKSSIEAEATLAEHSNYKGAVTTNDEDCYPVVGGEAFTIKVGSSAGAVLASYVTVDITNANLSTTDKAAINGLTFSGVNAVSQSGVHSITVTGTSGVVIPLKVTAIGYDGEQTSETVWVKAGNSAEISQTAAYVITPAAYVADPTEYAYSGFDAFTVPANATKMVLSIYAKNEVNINNAGNEVVLSNSVLTFYESNKKTVATAINKIAYAKLNATVNLQTMVDDKVYEGTVKFFNAEGTFLGQSAISVQKVLPTAMPAGFSIKTAQVKDGVYNCYLVPNNWDATEATAGTMGMDQVFNFGVGAAKDYKISFATTDLNAAGNAYTETKTVTGAQTLSVAKALIDNATEHATKVIYNYGQISSVKDANGAYVPVTIPAAEFVTVYNCIYNSTYTWNWATREQLGINYTAKNDDGSYKLALPYSTEVTYGDTNFSVDAAHIFGVSAWDSRYSAFLNDTYKSSLAMVEATLTSNANGVEEYFDVTISGTTLNFAQQSGATNPTAAVPSTLTIKCVDMYKHEIIIKLDMTVNKR